MGEFDLIEFGYNIADETINFGTRCLADGDNLYEASTLATLKCSEHNEGKAKPYINAAVRNDYVYFNVDGLMRIFKDKQCSDVIFNAGFETIVDAFCVDDDGAYLLVCLRDGMLHLIDCNNEYNCIFSKLCERDEDGDRFFVNAFLDNGRFLIVAKTGQVFRMVFQQHFKLECVYEFNFKAEIASFENPFLLVNGAKLAILDLENNNTVYDEGWEFRKIFPLSPYMFFALDFEGNLFRICAITLTVFPVNNSSLYIDMQLLSEKNQKQVIVVTEDETKQSFIQLLSYPDLTTIYKLKISNEIYLISLESLTDEILYISKISTDNSVSELRFHVVYETEPEQRLRRLLKKHKYEEAERFAALFHLDITLINKAKAQEIVDKTICTSEDINNLLNLLEVIDDDEFRLQCCSDVEASCTIDDVRRILSYGCRLQLKKHERRSVAEELQKSVTQLMFRFDTFVTVNRGIDRTMQAWLRFAGCDLIDEVKMLLRNYQIEEAKIVYSRLDDLTTEGLTEAHVADILTVVNNIPIATYQPFLPTFISITLSILPSTLPLFVKWTYSKVFNLESRSKADFPNNAIKFTEDIVKLMRASNVGDISFQRQCVLHHDSLLELSSLQLTLNSLKTLKDEYRISIPVTDYLAGPQRVIRLLLSIEMCPGDYDAFLKQFLCRYMVENHMDPNEILLGEITDLMNYEERYWVNIIGSILNCIGSVSVKLEAVKTILDLATVPWSDVVRKIAYDSLEYSHVLTAEIKELIGNEPMQVVLRNPKYKIKEKRIGGVDFLKFVLNRIIYCNEPTMVEDVYKLCKSPDDRHEANMLLITHFIRIKCFEKAMDILDDNSDEEVEKCAKELASMVETVVNSQMRLPDDLSNSYYEITRSIFKRLNRKATEFDRACNLKTLDLVTNAHNLRQHFEINTTTFDLRRSSFKDKVVEDVLESVCHDFEAGKRTTEEVFAVCHKLSSCLNVDNDDVLVRFCEKSGDYHMVFRTAQRVFEAEASARNLTLMAVLLLKYVGTYKIQLIDNSLSESEDSVIFSPSDSIVEDDVFCKGLQLAEVIMAKALYKATPDEYSACMEVAVWVKSSCYCTRKQESDVKQALFGDIYDSGVLPPGFLTFSSIKNVFNAFCSFMRLSNDPNSTYLTHFKGPTLTEDEFFRELNLLPPVLDNLNKEGQHFTAYKLVETLQTSLQQIPNPNTTILSFLNDLLKKHCIPKLLSAILSNSVIDCDFFYCLLLSCDRDIAIKFVINSLRMYKRHPRKFSCIIRTGLKFFDRYQISNVKAQMMDSLVTIKWWKKFETKKFEYDSFFKMKPEERFELLVNSDCLDMKLAGEYCEDYHLDSKSSYKYFLKRVFLNWKPDYEIKVDMNRRYLVVKNGEEDLLVKCRDVLQAIDQRQVFDIMTKLWSSVNTYYYEVFIAILSIFTQINPEQDNRVQSKMLFFLKIYQRVSKPSEAEIEHWYTHFPDTQSLDPLSEFRLSFTSFLFTDKIFDVIRPEINLNTYRIWFEAIEILKKPFLNKKEICSFVVKDVVASGVLSKDASDTWVLHPKHDDLIKEIDVCVLHIDDLERATSVMYHLMTHTSPGADQVNAARLCYKYALRYRRHNPESVTVERAVTKVEKKYFTYCAMHILHTHRLTERKYMNLLAQPKELILALYLDERIAKKNEMDLQCPDINKATEALASLFDLDIKKIRYTLITDWLGDSASSNFDFDTSVIRTSSYNEEDNLDRIAYVCCADEVTYWQAHLLQMGLGKETEEQISVHCKARVLKVFAMISDVETIAELTGSTYDEFMNFIEKFTLVSNLQYLGIGLDVEALDQYNKKELLNRLVQRTGYIISIKTMALICMTYEIYDTKYWEFILNSAIKFSLFGELKTYVCFLKKVKYQYKSFYINAWQRLIDNSFVQLNNSQQLDQTLLENFFTIQACPVLYCLNFDNAFRRCMDRDKVEFAAVLLQYFDGNKRDEYVEEIRNSNKDLVTSLNNLHQNGLWGISYVRTILASKADV